MCARTLRRSGLSVFLVGLTLVTAVAPIRANPLDSSDDRPNIVFIMADDLGYGDLGCYGQKLIQTPRLDRMAAEGMRFTQFYAGCTVCAPSRSVLMTGQHMGHTHVRGNAGADMSIQTLRDEDITVAEVLKKAGYATALCGKWGLGDEGPGGVAGLPNRQGFDFFFGYLNQVHAHNYYPEFLWRNETKQQLRNTVVRTNNRYGGFQGGYASKRVDYSHDLIASEALRFIRENKDGPFFLYVPLTIPHANNEGTRGTGNGQEVPNYGAYADKPWEDPDKGQAAMVSRMDADVGRILDLLAELSLDKKTVVMFTSDNGPHDEGGHNTDLFNPSGPLRGMKRDLYDGGIRVPMIVRWPGTTPAGATSDHIGYFGDLMATASELAATPMPEGLDSVSFAPTIKGHHERQEQHDYLYWEFYERGSKQAVRFDQWKAIRLPMHTGRTELFDVTADPGERRDVSADYPQVVARAEQMMKDAHVPHPNWKPRGKPAPRR